MCNPSSRRYVGQVPISLSLALILDLATITATTESQSPRSAWQDASLRTSFSATPVGIPGLLQSLYRVFVDPGSLCNPRRSGLRRFTSLFACLTLLVPLETHNLGEEASHKFKSSCGALSIAALFLFALFYIYILLYLTFSYSTCDISSQVMSWFLPRSGRLPAETPHWCPTRGANCAGQ